MWCGMLDQDPARFIYSASACRDNAQLRAELASMTERLRISGAASDGPVSAATAEGEAAIEVQALRQQLAQADEQLAKAQAEAEHAGRSARKLETELEDLSLAYSTLDAHANRLRQQVEQLQCDLAAGEPEDLLVCLGQAEAKVLLMRERLDALGVDPDTCQQQDHQ